MGLKLNGTHQLLTYADDVNLQGDNIDAIKKNRNFIDASKEVEVTKDYLIQAFHMYYMFLIYFKLLACS
jgi:hypothetical protein